MSEQTSPDLSPKPKATNIEANSEVTSKSLKAQHIDLKLEVEQIYRRVDSLKNWFQTLVSGLLVAVLIAIGVASWFSYRLLIEEKRDRQETQKTLALQEEMLDRLETLEEKIDVFDRQISNLREQIPQNVNSLIEENRQQLQQLQEQIQKLDIPETEAKTNEE